MSYTEFLKKQDSTTEGTVLFMAEKTKNIYQIDNLAEKKFIPAIFKRLEIAAKQNELEKVGELRRLGVEAAPIEYLNEIRENMDKIVKEFSPVLVKRSKMTVG